MSVLVVIEQSKGGIHRMSREAVAAGQALGQDLDLPVSALLLGNDTSDLCHSLDSTQLDEILQAEHPLLGSYSSDGFSQAVAQVIENESPRYVIAGHTYMVRDFFPRVSAKLNVPFLADNIAYRAEGGILTLTKHLFYRYRQSQKRRLTYRHKEYCSQLQVLTYYLLKVIKHSLH